MMALIECPSCGKQISDKATQCPACGYTKVGQKADIEEVKCEECGTVLNENDTICPTCGCPVEKKKEQDSPQKVEVINIKLPKINKKKKTAVIVVSILVIILLLGTITGIAIYQKNSNAKYKDNISLATTTMLLGASTAENAGNLIHDVWYNTIYEKSDVRTDKYTKSKYSFHDDFNLSLLLLMSDNDFKAEIESIEENQELVNSIMKNLVNPPNEYAEAYSKLQDLYNAYLELTNLAINPTGTLSSFTQNFDSADTATVNAYKAMKLYID